MSMFCNIAKDASSLGTSLLKTSLPALTQPVIVSAESAQSLSQAVMPVMSSLVKMSKMLPVIGIVGSAFLVASQVAVAVQNHDARAIAQTLLVGGAQLASKGLTGFEIDTFVETFTLTRQKLADKRFIAAVAEVAAGAVEVLTGMVAGSLAGHAAREGVRLTTKYVAGVENMPQQSDSFEAIKNSLFLKDRLTSVKPLALTETKINIMVALESVPGALVPKSRPATLKI